MLVRMKIQIGGYRNGAEWPPPGGTIDVPDHEAAGLIANGYAADATRSDEAVQEEVPDDVDPADPADDFDAYGGLDEPGDPVASDEQDGQLIANGDAAATVPSAPRGRGRGRKPAA